MFERLRMQEVSQIILSVPKGAVISNDTNLKYGDPIMIIDKPTTSHLSFSSSVKRNEDKGFISKSDVTKQINFTINDGAILYSLWSYLHGLIDNNTTSTLRGTEYLETDEETHQLLHLSAHENVKMTTLYKVVDRQLIKLEYNIDYNVYYTEEEGVKDYYIKLINSSNDSFLASYLYDINNVQVTTIKQISNNIFCALDMYFDAVDIDTEDKYKVCLHCDKVQIFTDLTIAINNSQKASFTPIEIHSIAENDIVATITVI